MQYNFINKIFNTIFPPVCGICGKLSDEYICCKCFNAIEPLKYNCIDKYTNKYFNEHLWIFKYKDKIRDLIVDYKFNDKSYLYRTFLEIIIRDSKIINYIMNSDVVMPVPIHRRRYKKRGYNQCSLIANGICKKVTKVEFKNDILVKVKNTIPQSKLNREERQDNIKGAFDLYNAYELENKNILLIDDVYTTGNTINECARTLCEKSNCKNVNILTIAKD